MKLCDEAFDERLGNMSQSQNKIQRMQLKMEGRGENQEGIHEILDWAICQNLPITSYVVTIDPHQNEVCSPVVSPTLLLFCP
jgi:hypothetical protein